MAKHVKLIQDIIAPHGKQWHKGEIHLVSCEVADSLVKDNLANYSLNKDVEFVEAIKEVKKTKKK